MPKRLANCKGRTNARFGRVRIGWKKQQIISELEKMDKAIREGNLEEDTLLKISEFKAYAKKQLGRFFPKTQTRRTQTRRSS